MEKIQKFISKGCLVIFNLSEFIGWSLMGFLLMQSFWEDPKESLRDIRLAAPNAFKLYQALQILQLLDIVFAIFGIVRSNIIATVTQTSVRTLFAATSASIHVAYYPVFFIALVCFTIVEIARYGANLFKTLDMKDFFLSRWLLGIRYNAFLICYPLGASLEALMHLEAVPVLLASDPMPYSLTMPN